MHHGDIDRYYDIISGNVANKPENNAESARMKVLAEFERLGGGKNANRCNGPVCED